MDEEDDRNRTWVTNPMDEPMLCATLFRDVCGDSRLLLSTVISLPCEVSTEALISDLELTRVSVDRFTAETSNLTDGKALTGSVSQGIQILAQRFPFKIAVPSSHPSPGLPILSSRVQRPRAHVRSSAGPPLLRRLRP